MYSIAVNLMNFFQFFWSSTAQILVFAPIKRDKNTQQAIDNVPLTNTATTFSLPGFIVVLVA